MSFVQKAIETLVKHSPDATMPGGTPDPLIEQRDGAVGKALDRVDGPQKVTGTATFAAEFAMDGMLYAAVAYSAIPKGRIASLDVAAAEAAPGVALVMTHENAPRLQPTPVFQTKPKAAGPSDLPIMQDATIHWNGQPIALVLAETLEQAEYAASLVHATYERTAAVTSFNEAKTTTRPAMFQGEPLKTEIGDAEAALAAAAHKVDVTYQTPRYNHNAIELHATTLAWQGDELIVHDASQGVAHMAWTLAQVFGVKEEQVHVTSPFVGGGFGGKTLWSHHILAAAAARVTGRPVRMVLSRQGVYRMVGGRTNTEQRVAIGARADGHFEAIIHTGAIGMTTHNAMPEPFILPTRSAYASETFALEVRIADMDMLANTFMRAPGESVGTFALECAVDELADRMGIDPIELRVRNEPATNPTDGLPWSSRHIVEAYRAGAKRFGWEKRSAAPGQVRAGEWLIGMGVATATYPYYRMPGGAARLTLSREGRVIAAFAAHEMGMGTATVQRQITAERLGVPIEDVTVAYGDSALPGVILAGGSQQTASIGGAIIAAHRELVSELLKLVGKDSPLHGLKPDDIVTRDGRLCKLDDPQRCESYTSILAHAKRDELTVEAQGAPPLELEHWSMHSHGAMFAEVRVNAITGEPRVSRFLASMDCGRIINPKTAMSQVRGGIIMGIGLALTEETQFDERNGRIMNPSLAEYHVPVHMDVPEIDVIWTDIADPHTPMGAHGVGEIGITGTGAAIANAIYNACGKRVRSLPITLDKLL